MANPVIFPGSTKSLWAFKVPKKIDVLAHNIRFVLERLSLEQKQHDPSIFAIRA